MEVSIMPTLQIRERFQFTLPPDIRKKLDVDIGDFFEATVEKDKIVLIPQKLISKEQAWFWSKKWQEGEKEAEEDLQKGHYKDFDDAKDAIKWLKK